MSGESKTVDKATADPLQAALSRMFKLNVGGAGGVAALLFGGFLWIKSQIETTVQQTVQSTVQAEIKPIAERLTRLEIEAEVQKRTNAKAGQ